MATADSTLTGDCPAPSILYMMTLVISTIGITSSSATKNAARKCPDIVVARFGLRVTDWDESLSPTGVFEGEDCNRG
ncbi:hypothetical protein AFUB_090290 [Aspergillus fumigatus A1163]|nr:hypothetical protein AFUB_090290 [Aspergillus fumigatus A1163]